MHEAFPVTLSAFIERCLDDLADIAQVNGDLAAKALAKTCPFACFLGRCVDLARRQRQRRQVKAKRVLDLAARIALAIAFAVGTVAPQDKPGINQRGKMPAQRRVRHASAAQRKFRIGREHHDRL